MTPAPRADAARRTTRKTTRRPRSEPWRARRTYAGASLEDRRHDQRSRLMLAARDVFAARGYQAASIEEIVARARVSRTAFYRFFEGKEGCLLAVYRDGVTRALAQFREVGSRDLNAVDKVRLGAATIIGFFGKDPALAGVMLIEVVGASPAAERARHEARLEFARVVQAALAESGLWRGKPRRELELVSVATMAAMVETVSHLVAAGRIGDWQSLVDPMSRYALRALAPDPPARS